VSSVVISSVPPSTRKPGTYLEINTRGAKAGLPVSADKVVLIGHKRPTGTAVPAVPVQVFSVEEARAAAGMGTPLALMVQALIEQSPYLAEVWLCCLQEAGGGAVAVGSITFTASSLQAGTLTVQIGRHAVQVTVAATDASTAIATAVTQAINEQGWLPFSAAVDGVDLTKVNLTARCKGTHGNAWVLRTEYTATGLSTLIVQPTSGAGDATIATALTAIYPADFDIVVSEWSDATALAALADHTEALMGPMEARPCIALAGVVGALGTVTTLTASINSGAVGCPYMRGSRTHPVEIAAAVAAAFASESDRARPLNGNTLKPVVPPDSLANYLSRTEQESCLANGAMPLEVVNGKSTIVRTVSTYVTNSLGDADDTLLDLQTLRVLFYVQYALRVKFREALQGAKLADDAKTPNTTDPAKMRALAIGWCLQMETELGYLENVEANKDRFVFERDASVSGRVNARIPADIVDGLHVFAAAIDLIL